MSKYALAGFLLLYGLSALIETKIPGWVLGVVALIAGVEVIVSGLIKKS